MQTLLKFVKMHALGNDFVILDRLTQSFFIDHHAIKALGHRKTGIGFDQLLILEAPNDPEFDFTYQVYNANGTLAKQCLNGVRCLAHYINDYGLNKKKILRLNIQQQSVICDLLSPIVVKTTLALNEHCQYQEAYSSFSIAVDRVMIGNDHLICWDVQREGRPKVLAELKEAGYSLDQFNISFAQYGHSALELETWERGVGRTSSCGSAALAAFLAYNNRFKETLQMRIEMQLGYVTATKNYDSLSLIGPISRVFVGEFLLKYN